MLVEAGGLQGEAGDRLGERVEQQQVRLEPADLVGDQGPLAAFAIDERTAGEVLLGGDFGPEPAAVILLDHLTVNAAMAVVVPAAVATRLPGHESVFSKRRNREAVVQRDGCGHTRGAAASAGGEMEPE